MTEFWTRTGTQYADDRNFNARVALWRSVGDDPVERILTIAGLRIGRCLRCRRPPGVPDLPLTLRG